MGRFSANDIDHYGGQGGAGYFSLKNDKDVARVRLMYNSIDDVEGYAVHEVEIDGKKRYINCLRESYNSPIADCPFCREKKPQLVKLFVPLYNIDQDKVQVWERGKKFAQKISSFCSRYSNPVSHIVEIERNGKAGSQTTTYEMYEVDDDDTTLDDLPELPMIMGSIVLEKSVDDMEYYLENGQFPPDEDDVPIRRRSESRSSERSERRTPATTSGGRREVF